MSMITQLASSNVKTSDQSLDSISYTLSLQQYYSSITQLPHLNASFSLFSRDPLWDTNLLPSILNLNFKGFLAYMYLTQPCFLYFPNFPFIGNSLILKQFLSFSPQTSQANSNRLLQQFQLSFNSRKNGWDCHLGTIKSPSLLHVSHHQVLYHLQ